MEFGSKHDSFLNSVNRLFQQIKQSFALQRFFHAWHFRITWLSFLLGIVGLLFLPTNPPSFLRLCFSALTEELTWRTLIQTQCEESTKNKKFLGITYGNYLSSSVFALMHLFTQSPLFALSTFFPSLVFGIIWTRFQSTWLCVLLHLWYNIIFFYM